MHVSRSLLVWFCGLCHVTAVYKRWITTTDFDNAKNWNLGHLPCPNDRITFPASSPVVAINQDWTLSDLTLSNDGIIVLADNLNLVFNDNPTLSDNCQTPRDIRYNFTTATHWLDPINWCLPMHDFDSECFTEILQLHTEMIPCVTDDVLFPGLIVPRHRSSFYVSLDLGANVHLSTLKIGHQYYSTDSFKEYILTDIGRMEFIQEQGSSPSILNITTRTCADPAGCYCGMNRSPWKEKICAYVGSCPEAYCHNAITPTGHCCPICGAKMDLVINATIYSVFHIRDLLSRDYIQNKDKNYADVLFDVTRLDNGNSQMTLTDKSEGQTSVRLAAEVRQLLQQGIGTEHSYGVLAITNYNVSGTPESTPAAPTTTVAAPTTTPATGTSSSTPTAPGKPTVAPPTKPKSTVIPDSSSTTPLPPTAATAQPATTNSRVTAKSSSSIASPNDLTIIGGIFIAICIVMIGSIFLICYCSKSQAASSAPTSISIKFDENGAGSMTEGSVTFSHGLDNPLYDEEGDIVSVPMETMTSAGAAAGSKPPAGKKPLKKKKSTGFNNPMYFDSKTETLESGDPNSKTFANPLYDEEERGQFEENFM